MTVRVEFFESAAQLAPVLFIALILERRFKIPSHLQARWRKIDTSDGALLVIGEVVSMGTIATGRPTVLGTAVVAGSLALPGISMLRALAPEPKKKDEPVTDREELVHVAWTLVAALTVTLGFVWLGVAVLDWI